MKEKLEAIQRELAEVKGAIPDPDSVPDLARSVKRLERAVMEFFADFGPWSAKVEEKLWPPETK